MQHARLCSLLFSTRRTACRGPTARPELLVCGAGACTPGTAPAPVLPPQAARLSQPVKRRIASSQGDLGRGCAAPSAARFFKMLQIPGLRCCATTERHAHLGRACLALKNLWRHLCRYVRRECAAEKRKRREGHRHACRCVRRGVCHNREYSANLQCSHGTPQRRSSWAMWWHRQSRHAKMARPCAPAPHAGTKIPSTRCRRRRHLATAANASYANPGPSCVRDLDAPQDLRLATLSRVVHCTMLRCVRRLESGHNLVLLHLAARPQWVP